jgi:hypothetical protein
MKTVKSQIIICGASLGGTLAAYSSAKEGKDVVLLESTKWIGGQLTSQAVPPDEHPWIEDQGCTKTYREYREKVRDHFRALDGFSEEVKKERFFCPGASEVSFVAHPPKLALSILKEMLAPYVTAGNLKIYTEAKLLECITEGDDILGVIYEISGEQIRFEGEYYLDGTDIGDLIKLSGAEYRVGAESREETGEVDAPVVADPEDMQAYIYTACIENRREGDYTIEKPELYDTFASMTMPYDSEHKVFSMLGPNSSTGKAKRFAMFPGEFTEDGKELFPLFWYRRIVNSEFFTDGSHPYDVTLVNWPQNDFFLGNLFDCEDAERNDYLARQYTLSFIYWLQTEAPRYDGGKGYPYFRLATEYLGTDDGLSMAPYIRESRRIKARFTVTETAVCDKEGCRFPDSVGVGSYPIDLHITNKTHTFFYKPTYRFTIPLGAMIPERMKNLIPSCKNIGSTHLTNGCYRLHPVEWNIGEVAGYLASFSIDRGVRPLKVWEDKELFGEFAKYIEDRGIQRYWNEEPIINGTYVHPQVKKAYS